LPLAAGGEVTTTKVDFEPNVVEGRELITAGNCVRTIASGPPD
jgi:hypothetical protein